MTTDDQQPQNICFEYIQFKTIQDSVILIEVVRGRKYNAQNYDL